jgi:RNA polymerase sigma-70 factor (ECF subfamily)
MLDGSTQSLPTTGLPLPVLAPIELDRDSALMLRFRDGDRAAFAHLYERHFEAVLKVCARIVGPKASRDLAHDTFVTAFERRDQWSPQPGAHAVRAWFTTIATRKCLDLVRKASTRRERAEDTIHDRPVDPETPDHRCRAILLEGLAELPREQREVVMMKVGDGLTYREIAALTGVAEPALKSRFRLARNKLLKHLETAGLTREALER